MSFFKKVKQYMTGRYTSDYTYRTETVSYTHLPVRISVELTLSNGLHILQKDLDYPGLYRLIQKLEVLC